MEKFNVETDTLKAALPFGYKGAVDILIRVEGPDRPKNLPTPPAKQIAFVIDRSGSMAGEPLREAEKAVITMASKLTKKDVMAIVTYDSEVCLLYTSPSPRDATLSRMPSSA